MKSKVYNIIYGDINNLKSCRLTTFSLPKFVDDLLKQGTDNIFIVSNPNASVEKFEEKQRKKEVQTYYNSQYSQLYRQHKSNKITDEEFKEILEILKKFKKESNSKEEIEKKFEEYKKANTIPPYSDSL